MPIFEFGQDAINALSPTSFSDLGLTERGDLQRLLRDLLGID